jgi:hypothetical protein
LTGVWVARKADHLCGGSTPALTTQPVVNPAAVNGNGADSNGLTPTPTR